MTENVSTNSGIPRIPRLLTPSREEKEPDCDRARDEGGPGEDLEERRHS
jgi:hypothetical protein